MGSGGLSSSRFSVLLPARARSRATAAQFAGQHRHHRVVAQFVVVDQVLVAQRDADHALHHQRLYGVFDKFGVAAIGEAGGQTPGQADDPVGRAEQQRAGIRGDAPAIEGRHHGTAFDACKLEQA